MSAPRPGRAAALALSLGEPAGIGPDVVLAAWRERADLPPFYVVGDPSFLRRRALRLGLDIAIATVAPEEATAAFARALPVVDTGHRVAGEPGQPAAGDAPAVIAAIERGVADIARGQAAALVTAPIAKSALYGAGFGFPGHTEFLGALARQFGRGPGPDGTWRPVMMLAGPELRTVPVTVHVGLAEVPRILDADLIVETGRIVAADLRHRFGIDRPRLAVAGLNPHAGESGSMGREDEEIVRPAVERLQAEGIDAFGPLPSDTMFHPRARAGYDVALAMYHDQALIPVKTIAFDETVNVTLGLPFVRTSPDHGTAFDIAGSGRARPDSLKAALRLAARLSGGPARAVAA